MQYIHINGMLLCMLSLLKCNFISMQTRKNQTLYHEDIIIIMVFTDGVFVGLPVYKFNSCIGSFIPTNLASCMTFHIFIKSILLGENLSCLHTVATKVDSASKLYGY